MSETHDTEPSPGLAAFTALTSTVIVGVLAAYLIEARTVRGDFGSEYAVLTETPIEAVGGTFNLLVLAIFLAAGCIAACAAWAGSTVSRQHWRMRNEQREHARRAAAGGLPAPHTPPQA